MFTKGHTLSRGKRKPGGGKKKSPTTLAKEALDRNDINLPKYLQRLDSIAMSDTVRTSDCLNALISLINRSQGMPKAQTDLRVSAIKGYSPDERARMLQIIENEQKLLKEWGDDGQKAISEAMAKEEEVVDKTGQ